MQLTVSMWETVKSQGRMWEAIDWLEQYGR